jgi:hypothetical protein
LDDLKVSLGRMNAKSNDLVSPNRSSGFVSKIPRIIPKPPAKDPSNIDPPSKDEEEKISLKKLKIKIKK